MTDFGMLLLAIGIATGCYFLGSGIEGFGYEIRKGLETIAEHIGYIFNQDQDES